MEIRFLTGYRGPYTQNTYYQSGQKADIPDRHASWLIDSGWALPAEIEVTQVAIDAALSNHVNLSTVSGSGASGRIVVKDVMKTISRQEVSA